MAWSNFKKMNNKAGKSPIKEWGPPGDGNLTSKLSSKKIVVKNHRSVLGSFFTISEVWWLRWNCKYARDMFKYIENIHWPKNYQLRETLIRIYRLHEISCRTFKILVIPMVLEMIGVLSKILSIAGGVLISELSRTQRQIPPCLRSGLRRRYSRSSR